MTYPFDQVRGVSTALGEASQPREYLLKYDVVTDRVMISVHGGPWVPLAGAGGASSLQTAYDGFTGSGSGRAIVALAAQPVAISTAVPASQPPLALNGVNYFTSAGAPNNADGANGDYYFRVPPTRGGSATTRPPRSCRAARTEARGRTSSKLGTYGDPAGGLSPSRRLLG